MLFAYSFYSVPLQFIKLHIENSPVGLYQLIAWPCHTIVQILISAGVENSIVICI